MVYDLNGFANRLMTIVKDLKETRTLNNDLNFDVIQAEWDIENIIEDATKLKETLGENEPQILQ